MNYNNHQIAIIGLGYVGLPLAVEFSKKYNVVGFDINIQRINELNKFIDKTKEVEKNTLKEIIVKNISKTKKGLLITNEIESIKNCNVFIITVPTPIDKFNRPLLMPLYKASETVGRVLKKNDIVIYESTVYPGLTEEECVPVLENISKLKFNKDFFVGYSPERINPGDKEHTVSKIKKITSGSNIKTANIVDKLYSSIIVAGTFKASSIKVAEAAKVIENSQRDINIAFVNELSKIFTLLNIDTNDVLEAASTKWNFLNFKPGLVGGHCIGVDPYYLAQKAQEIGYHPEIILAGRRTNDSMGKHIVLEIIKHMLRKNLKISRSKILILGFTFKENCPDFRNTRVIDIYHELKSFDTQVDIFDPWVDEEQVKIEYGINMITKVSSTDLSKYSGIILAVAHNKFKNIKLCTNANQVIFDVKGILPIQTVDARL
jgi:UDP-N-acetyl-D-galactosamine dehydrogenase